MYSRDMRLLASGVIAPVNPKELWPVVFARPSSVAARESGRRAPSSPPRKVMVRSLSSSLSSAGVCLRIRCRTVEVRARVAWVGVLASGFEDRLLEGSRMVGEAAALALADSESLSIRLVRRASRRERTRWVLVGSGSRLRARWLRRVSTSSEGCRGGGERVVAASRLDDRARDWARDWGRSAEGSEGLWERAMQTSVRLRQRLSALRRSWRSKVEDP